MLFPSLRPRRIRKSSRCWIGRAGLDVLEGREVPASLVTPWPDPQHLTISFAPDGTGIGNQTSSLIQALDAQVGTNDPKVWQREVLRAAQTWASVTNINLGVVADGGQAFGAQGAPEGDTRFGDIRIGAAPQSSGTLALTQPPSVVAGTWAGDMTLNSSASFGIGSKTDLYTVALHEFGHAFGLDDNTTDTTSVMYGEYTGPRTGLSAADVSAIQAIYGVRQADAFEGSTGNETLKMASKIYYDNGFTASQVQTSAADVTTHADQDYYYFTIPKNETTVNVRLKTSGISLLKGQMTVYDGSWNAITTVAATDPLSGDLVVPLNNLKFNSLYYVKVQGASGDAFGIGGYNLQLDYRAATVATPAATTSPVGYIVASASPDNTINSALSLTQRSSAADPRFQYSIKDSISSPTDGHMYWISHASNASATSAMTVTAWGLETGGLQPMITVYDNQSIPVAATVLFNENGTYTIVVPNANSSGYTIAVKAASPTDHALGNYFLGIDFGDPATTLNALGSGQVAPASNGVDVPITAPHDDLFHFTLGGSATSTTTSMVQLTILDGQGRVVSTLTSGANQTRSLTVFLSAGTYTARLSYVAGSSGATVPLSYTLFGADLSDPIKVYSSTAAGATPPA